TTRISVNDLGVQADGPSVDPAISADGRYVLYTSHATNLVPGDTNGVTDGFLWDRTTGKTTRGTVGNGGVQGNGDSELDALSAHGRYVVFDSAADNLVGGDTDGQLDVFVRDLQLGVTTRISNGLAGAQPDGPSYTPVFAANGRYVVYLSFASNLVPGDSNGNQDVFRYDRLTGATERVSVSSSGGQSVGFSDSESVDNISPDGRFIVFDNDGDDLVAGDANGVSDVYVRDMLLGTTARASLTSTGASPDSSNFNESVSV